mmetsp:Transcript_3836/g.10905  ORF Transcript_3836/g.10905 Transcript_3836/m.10905 type:complete len:144 (+) Transcript_3836:303-734(+)|eukprot:CAMPEP_0172363552 /NCGR_PEP_ID=MMETSP1060-20121228/6875_1 /TAXON_ID=37318 /ORGANISM="Pseudo-nitzschia pungens, Strain cf. cingulata" /LENGTH=143 /DNA_ID=CAMNT_0013086307 /DNA_START=265 /DNA_END=696 /DNA_ORIENTATION=+
MTTNATNTTKKRTRLVLAAILCWGMTLVDAFGMIGPGIRTTCRLGLSTSDENQGPSFPSSFGWHDPAPASADSKAAEGQAGDGEEEPTGQANTRFSVFAPDPNLEADDFRSQLRANMKADLERRRKEDPNRGNQIAKNYLDSL